MTAKKRKKSGTSASANVEAGGADAPPQGPRAPILTAAIIVLGLLLALGVWLLYGAFTRPLAQTADPAELSALSAQLTKIENAARPIAASFTSETSETSTAAIDVTAYRDKVAALRNLVDSTNDLSATSPDALEIRDLILTGGSQIAAGMSAALDALVSDEASATIPAAQQIDEGLANLSDAHAKLDTLLGRVKTS